MNVESVTYHRNGVGGEGFYAVEFTDPEILGCDLLGIVGDAGLVAVLDRADPRARWRGHDYYADQLRHVCEVWSLTGEAHNHATP